MIKSKLGFTLVEVLIVVVVLALLATIGIVSYRGIRERTVVTTLHNDLTSAADAIEIALIRSREVPSELPSEFRASKGVTLSMSGDSLPIYTGLSAVQNGVLFYQICGDLVADGYGRGVNNGGQQEQYITACNVYNHPQLQVNSSWGGPGRIHNTPISSSVLPGVVAAINYNDSWRPERDTVEKGFFQTWHDRFQAMGGTYPVTSFWDPWASPGNGVMKQELPEPGAASTSQYCVEAVHETFPSLVYHVTSESEAPVTGGCG